MNNIAVLFSSFLMVFLAELGDKTQLFTMSLANKYKPKDIFVGIVTAITALNLVAIYLGGFIADIFPETLVSLVAGMMFFAFALTTLFSKEKEGTVNEKKFKMHPMIIIALSFFIAELGDKTQLSAISLSATSDGKQIYIFIGCALGMLLSDLIGFFAGKIIADKIPSAYVKSASSILFIIFAAISFKSPLQYMFGTATANLLLLVSLPTIIILVFSFYFKYKVRRQ